MKIYCMNQQKRKEEVSNWLKWVHDLYLFIHNEIGKIKGIIYFIKL